MYVGEKSTGLHWDKYASETRLHGMWAKGLTSLGPSFLICEMKILMPTSCDCDEIKIMYEIMYKGICRIIIHVLDQELESKRAKRKVVHH